MDDYDLFGLSLEERVTGSRAARDSFIQAAWRKWEFATNRPRSSAPDRFRRAVREALDEKMSEDRINRAIAAAVHIRPAGRDPMDVRRVIRAISNPQVESQVLALLDSGDAPMYLWDVGDPEANLSGLAEVREACDLDLDMWTHRDHECSGIIMQTLTPQRLEDAATKVKLHMGVDSISPSDIVRWSSIWRNPDKKVRVASNANRDTYTSGKQEADALGGIDIGLDKTSERALISGCPASQVRDYHLQAPAEYWSRVALEVEENLSASLDSIYDMISKEFSWHPDNRGELKW